VTLAELKGMLFSKTCVPVANQKIMGVKGQSLSSEELDKQPLQSLTIQKAKDGYQIMLLGNPEVKILKEPDPNVLSNVVDDFEFDYWPTEEEVVDIKQRQQLLQKAISETSINVMNPLDPKKKLLVLDLDNTLFDFSGRRKTMSLADTMRPGLVEFLGNVYQHYNIVIWSATDWKWLEIKLIEFGLIPHVNFSFCFVLDKSCMFAVKSKRKGVMVEHTVKALAIIWAKYPQFHAKNTVHVDDLSRNFAMNAQNGLKIKAFKYSPETVQNDRELYYLSTYLSAIASVDDISSIDHSKWRQSPMTGADSNS